MATKGINQSLSDSLRELRAKSIHDKIAEGKAAAIKAETKQIYKYKKPENSQPTGDTAAQEEQLPAAGTTASMEGEAEGASHTHKGTEPRPHLTLVPYIVIKALSALDNIYETRLFGWTLAKAQAVLKLYNKDLSSINIEHAMNLVRVTIPARMLLCEGDKNYGNIKRSFTLARKTIEIEKDGRLLHLNIIAFPELRKEGGRLMVTYVIHNDLWHALLDFSKGYRLFSLETFMKLSSKYSIIFYLLITQQSGQKTYTLTILRQLLGVDTKKAYEHSGNFFARVIDPAQRELKEKAPWYFEYSATKDGRSHRITNVIITPVLNTKAVEGNADVTTLGDKLRLRLHDDVQAYLTDNFKMKPREIETIEPLLFRLGDTARQLAVIGEIKARTLGSRVKKPAGYLVRSLQNMSK